MLAQVAGNRRFLDNAAPGRSAIIAVRLELGHTRTLGTIRESHHDSDICLGQPLNLIDGGKCSCYLIEMHSGNVPSQDIEPLLVGCREFCYRIDRALELLRLQACDEHAMVQRYISIIEQHMDIPTWVIPPHVFMSNIVAFGSPTWCAAVLVHEAMHSKLYWDYHLRHHTSVPLRAWTGLDAELQCLQLQLSASRKIGSPRNEVIYLESMNGSHFTDVRIPVWGLDLPILQDDSDLIAAKPSLRSLSPAPRQQECTS